MAFVNVDKSFGAVQVFHDITFKISPGSVVGLLGENGAGKSTLMKILAGYEKPSGGEVRVDGQVVNLDGPRAAESLGIAMIHQEFALARRGRTRPSALGRRGREGEGLLGVGSGQPSP